MSGIRSAVTGPPSRDPADPCATGRRAFVAGLAAILLVAAAFRLVGIDWDDDAPFAFHMDEPIVVDPAHQLLTKGELLPHKVKVKGMAQGQRMFQYPPLMSEIIAVEALLCWPLSSWKTPADVPRPWLRMAGRFTSTAAALLSIVVLALLARATTGSGGVGLFAAAVLALSPLHAESSRYAGPDILAGLFVLLAACAAVSIVRRGAWRDYAFGGAAVGFAACAKYPAALSCVLIATAHFVRPRFIRLSLVEHVKPLVAAVFCALGVILALPPGLVEYAWLLDGARFQREAYERGFWAMNSPHPGLSALDTLFAVGLTEGVVLVSLLGLPLLRRPLAPIWVLVIAYLVLLEMQTVYMARNLLHMLPAAILLAAYGFHALGSWLARTARPWTVLVLAAALLAPAGVRAGSQAQALSKRDTRLLARDWIKKRVRKKTWVAVTGEMYRVPLKGLGLRVRRYNRPNLDRLRQRGFRYLVYSDAVDLRYTRAPEWFPEQVDRIERWREEVRKRARLVARFRRRPLPGWDLPGSTANMYHQPNVFIYRLK